MDKEALNKKFQAFIALMIVVGMVMVIGAPHFSRTDKSVVQKQVNKEAPVKEVSQREADEIIDSIIVDQ